MATMGTTQQKVIDSKMRQFFQRYYEFSVIRKQLRRCHLTLKGKVILDAGCASGYSTALIQEFFAPQELWAFDLMPEQVALAKQRGLSARLFVGDIAAMDLPDEKFDAVFTFGVFHHVPQWPEALSEVYRVLKPGGMLVGGELSRSEAAGFTWEGFAKDIAVAGFQEIESQKIYFGYFRSFVCRK